MVEIKWLRDAQNDLREIYDYISLDSKRYAHLQVEKIINATKIIKIQPEIGKILEATANPKIRELVEGNYRIIYRIIDLNKIHILMVHHSARDLRRRF